MGIRPPFKAGCDVTHKPSLLEATANPRCNVIQKYNSTVFL